jgi:hypothetical protein
MGIVAPEIVRREIAAVFEVVKPRSTPEEICIICPVPGCGDKTGNRHINLKTLRTHCFRCLEPQPNHVKTLFRLIGHEFSQDHVLDVQELQEVLDGELRPALTPIQDIPLPAGFRRLSENRQSCYWRFCRDMARRKHLDIEDLEEAGAGFVREGLWEPYCVFPVYEGRHLVYYQGRTYTDDGFTLTKRFPSRQDVPYGMSFWIYNLDALANPAVRTVIIVESILNVLSLRRRLRQAGLSDYAAICTFTHRLSRPQVFKLDRYRHITEICVLFDSDSYGLAVQSAQQLDHLRDNLICRLSVARMPVGVNPDGSPRPTNDANDDVEAAWRAVAERQPFRSDEVAQAKLEAAVGRFTGRGPLVCECKQKASGSTPA